jgi:response regulator RpfG family c-di-GMP phosphodiesterase
MKENITVMVVDDDPDVLFATARIVKNAGYPVMKASSATECQALIQEQRPDLILLDVVLPDMDGPELCQKIKSDPALKGIFVILISGMKTSSSEQADGLDVGADGYIVRPISNNELKARVNAMVRILIAERDRDRLIVELRGALSKVKRLSGLLPICSHCKKIRDDKGYWNKIETYIHDHSEAEFSHGICQECAKEHYPDFDIYDD